MSDAVSEYIKCQYNQADRNRRDLQIKWERNRRDFLGNLFPDTEKPIPAGDSGWKKGEAQDWRSKSFPQSTHQKVLGGLAVVLDVILSGGNMPFMLKDSPFNKQRARVGGQIDPKANQKSIDAMTDRIQQQLSDCHAERAMIKSVLSAALYGWTYGKMVVKSITRSGWMAQQPEIPGIEDMSRLQQSIAPQWSRWEETFNAPHWIYVPVWDIFRDWETDELDQCGFILHRQPTSNWWLRQKKGKFGFIDEKIQSAIDRVKTDNTKSSPTIQNNEDTSNLSPVMRNYILYRQNPRQYLEYWGRMPREVVESFEADMKNSDSFSSTGLVGLVDDGDEVEVCAASLEGEDTVRFVRTKPEMRPFVQSKWEDNGDEWMARGVADNCEEMSKVIRGTFRGMEDNIKLAGNVTVAVKERFIKNMPNEFRPGMKLLLAEECIDARAAIQQVVFQDVSTGLSELFAIASKQMDEDSMVPKIAQGMVEQKNQTAREAAIRQAQSQKYLGMVIRNLDEYMIEPMIRKFYEYNMEDPEVMEGRGNYLVQALGFTSFQNKSERVQKLMQSLTMALNNPKLEAETKIREIWIEIQKALDLDPDQILKTDEEKQQAMQMMQQNPQFQLQVAGRQAIVHKDESVAKKNEADAALKMAKVQDAAVDMVAKEAIFNQQGMTAYPSLSNAGSIADQTQPQTMIQPTGVENGAQ